MDSLFMKEWLHAFYSHGSRTILLKLAGIEGVISESSGLMRSSEIKAVKSHVKRRYPGMRATG